MTALEEGAAAVVGAGAVVSTMVAVAHQAATAAAQENRVYLAGRHPAWAVLLTMKADFLAPVSERQVGAAAVTVTRPLALQVAQPHQSEK